MATLRVQLDTARDSIALWTERLLCELPKAYSLWTYSASARATATVHKEGDDDRRELEHLRQENGGAE